jgi:gliding motility-associated-like protein
VAEFVVPFYDAAYAAEWTYTAPGGAPVPFGTGPGTTSVGDGLYTVVLETGAPCFLEAVGTFTVVTDICDLLIPNVITPNGDDFNAAFEIPGLHRLPGTRCTVFNRWGTALYVHEDFGAAEGWAPEPDGTAEGTYFYELLLPVTGGSLRIADASGVREVTLDRPVRLTGILTVLR